MSKFNMLNDFRFVFPQKKDLYKNVHAETVNFRQLEEEYCIYLYHQAYGYHAEKIENLIVSLKHEYAGLQQGEIIFTSGKERESVNKKKLEIIKKDLHKKMRIFERVRQYHNAMMSHNKKIGSLCFSLLVAAPVGEPIPTHMNTIKKLSTHFFNNIRSRATFKHHVPGYFWVVLKNRDDNRPYLHVHFYLDTQDFNDIIGEEINRCWFNALKRNNNQGGVLHLTVTNEYRNAVLSRSTEGYRSQSGARHTIFNLFNYYERVITKDMNFTGTEMYKQFTNHQDENYFMHYLYALAKESYFITEKNRFFGSSSIMKRLK